jgi:hypothetical protein
MTVKEFHATPKRFKSVDEFMELMEKGQPFAEREFYYDESEY